jgi:anti-sigma factor (TIGR02949 family)
MSCGNPHDRDCSQVLGKVYEYLDRELGDADCAGITQHLEECAPCLREFGLEEAVKSLVRRCCSSDEVPTDLRDKVLGRLSVIRSQLDN